MVIVMIDLKWWSWMILDAALMHHDMMIQLYCHDLDHWYIVFESWSWHEIFAKIYEAILVVIYFVSLFFFLFSSFFGDKQKMGYWIFCILKWHDRDMRSLPIVYEAILVVIYFVSLFFFVFFGNKQDLEFSPFYNILSYKFYFLPFKVCNLTYCVYFLTENKEVAVVLVKTPVP